MRKELDWKRIKERHHVKLKPFLYAEDTLKTIILSERQQAKIEMLEEFEKANPYYYSKIEECKDFQKIIKKLKKR